VLPKIGKGRSQLAQTARTAAGANQTTAGAKPAIDSAAIGDEQEGPIGVTLDQLRGDLVRFFPQGIGQISPSGCSFRTIGNQLAPDRTTRIARIHEREKVRGDRNRKARLLCPLSGCVLFRGQIKGGAQTLRSPYAILQLPLPGGAILRGKRMLHLPGAPEQRKLIDKFG
jgi:hypothetical protein